MGSRLSFSSYLVVGVMLFALFFGAGNLIFPATLGQNAGTNMWIAVFGFLITGVGLPFLGLLAMGFSGSRNLQELASRVHPIYAVIFTSLLYLTIGPFFATPRTGAVAFDIGITPFLSPDFVGLGQLIFTGIFFFITLWFSLNPARIVDRVGKWLSPGIIILLFLLLMMAIVKPMGTFETPQGNYFDQAFMTGFLEGYNTMDALASLVFGIIVIHAIRTMGVTSKTGVMAATFKTGIVAIFFLAVIYIGIAYIGATSTSMFGLFDTGGAVLSSTASHYFGKLGIAMLSVIIILACLTTSIGLITACGEYFRTLFPAISYRAFVIFFSALSFTIANFGLTNIINYSIPVLMLLYPLAIALIILTFLSPLFNHARLVYVMTIFVALLISIIDGLKTFCEIFELEFFDWMKPVVTFYENYLPLYDIGLGWLVPVMVTITIFGLLSRLFAIRAND